MKSVRPKKNLGQHFLTDLGIAKAIADTVDACPDIPVLEVGPGMGVMTQYIYPKGRPFKVVEIDRESVAYLNEVYPKLRDNIISADFLKMDLNETFDGKQFVLTGNYPYDISSQIFFKMLDNKELIPCCTGMIQREVAQRIAAQPGNKTYGILSVMIQAYYDVEYLFTVDEHVFNPPPKVKSAVIRMTRNKTEHLDCDEKLFKTLVKTLFGQRRKMIRGSIKQLFTEQPSPEFFEHPFMTKRPEQLSIQQFVALTNYVEQNITSPVGADLVSARGRRPAPPLQTKEGVRLLPPAKINLGLNIVAKRPDGYHNLETVFYPLHNVTDILEVNVVDGEPNTVVLTLDGNPVDGDPEKNLVVKAYRLLAQDFNLPAMTAKLTKRIPMQAGMGGGSADAAYMLKAVNELAKLNLDDDKLEEYALKLGADAPFFIRCQPCYAEGVGEKMTPVALDLSAYTINYIKPDDISVSTADAFRNIPVQKPIRRCDDIVLNEPVERWKDLLHNDFETTVFAKHPRLAAIKQQMYDQGALYAAMTGSGSAIIALLKTNN